MDLRKGFAKALRELRKRKGLTQEDFSDVSSRTYLSTLERGMKSPTLDKIVELAAVMEVHPITLLVMTFSYVEKEDVEVLCKKVVDQAKTLTS
jgi:transcriptional regulator with XRE-family HTH domain